MPTVRITAARFPQPPYRLFTSTQRNSSTPLSPPGLGLYWLCLVFFHQIKLSLGKEHPCQPLPAQIIPAHLAAVAAAAAIGNSFTHRTNHATNHAPTPTLFQTQTLPPALLRPAPGPVRTSHPQVLFAPYWSVWPRRLGTAFCQRHLLHPDQAKESWQNLYSFHPSRRLNINVLWLDHFHLLMWINSEALAPSYKISSFPLATVFMHSVTYRFIPGPRTWTYIVPQ